MLLGKRKGKLRKVRWKHDFKKFELKKVNDYWGKLQTTDAEID